jgi:hypothetical protein
VAEVFGDPAEITRDGAGIEGKNPEASGINHKSASLRFPETVPMH